MCFLSFFFLCVSLSLWPAVRTEIATAIPLYDFCVLHFTLCRSSSGTPKCKIRTPFQRSRCTQRERELEKYRLTNVMIELQYSQMASAIVLVVERHVLSLLSSGEQDQLHSDRLSIHIKQIRCSVVRSLSSCCVEK